MLKGNKFQLRVNSDAAFACNDNLSSQIGYLILFYDIENNADVLDYFSWNSKIVVRSITKDELCAFLAAFDFVLPIHKLFEKDIGKKSASTDFYGFETVIVI